MALDKNCTNVFYLTGRFIAVVESSNGKKFSPSQIDNIFQHPVTIIRYDQNKLRYDTERADILSKMPATGFPEKLNPEEASRVWVGYHHQRATMPVETIVVEHEPEKVDVAKTNNVITELMK